MMEPAMATSTSMTGLKTEAYSGPLIPTHHAITTTINPDATIPCNATTPIKVTLILQINMLITN